MLKLKSKNTISFSISLFLNLIESIIFILIIFFFVIRISFVQNSLSYQFTNIINENLKSNITIKEVSLRSFDHLQLNQILIPDLNGDTILFVPNAVIKFNNWDLLERNFQINKVLLRYPIINIKKNKGKEIYELEYLLKVFENTQRKGKKYKVNIDEIELEKSLIVSL